MKKLVLFLIVPFALLLGVGVASAQKNTTASSSMQRAAPSTKAMWNNFRPETLNGTISVVEPSKKSVFVTSSGGVS